MATMGTWRPRQAPAQPIRVGNLIVRRYAEDDAASLDGSIRTSIEHLRPWMPWIAHEPQSIEQRRDLIRDWSMAWDLLSDFTMGIFDGDEVVGGTGLHLRGGPGSMEIGYWIRVDRTGRGTATQVVRALAEVAFTLVGVERVEIHHDVANVPSGRVAEAAGFTMVREYDRRPVAPAEIGRAKVWVSSRER